MYVEHRNSHKSLMDPEALHPTCEWAVSAVVPSMGNGLGIKGINIHYLAYVMVNMILVMQWCK